MESGSVSEKSSSKKCHSERKMFLLTTPMAVWSLSTRTRPLPRSCRELGALGESVLVPGLRLEDLQHWWPGRVAGSWEEAA